MKNDPPPTPKTLVWLTVPQTQRELGFDLLTPIIAILQRDGVPIKDRSTRHAKFWRVAPDPVEDYVHMVLRDAIRQDEERQRQAGLLTEHPVPSTTREVRER